MNKMKEEMVTLKRSKGRMTTIAKTQQQAIEEAEGILKDVLKRGISSADVEYREDICYDIEGLIDYYVPGILRSFRHLFSILYHANNPKMYPEILAHVNYLLAVLGQAKEYLKLRAEGADPDVTSLVEAHLGYLWKNIDFLKYEMYEEEAEIIQLSFNSIEDNERTIFVDKGYWINLKTGKIYYASKIRPTGAARFIKANDTELEVLQPQKLFVYPGKTNSRIRWEAAEKRKVDSNDIIALLENAETDYVAVVNKIKESFRDSLAERTPAILIKLHKTFINGEHLVLEDEQGGLLTVADLRNDNAPTSKLLRAILPKQPEQSALLVEVNDDIQSGLFSVKPLSIVTSDRIIRLLY